MKKCYKCQKVLPLSDFYKNKTRYDGLQNMCKACRKACDLKRIRPYDKEREARFKEKRFASYLKRRNLEKKREESRAHYQANKPSYFARAIARANKLQQSAIVKADMPNIIAIYKKAKELRLQGQDVEVDHIIPLNGKNVSGLHVSWNLQIISRAENKMKRNKFGDVHVF